MNDNTQWHLDKKVPIGLLFAIFCQTAGAFWWASGMDARMANIEASDAKQSAHDEITDRDTKALAISSAGVAAQLQSLDAGQKEIKETLHEQNEILRQLSKGTGR